MSLAVDAIGLSEVDVVMPIVPMFHANAWALPYSAAFAGADLLLPGHGRTGKELVDLLEEHGVTVTAAVASVWRDMLPHAEGRNLNTLRRPLTGGGPLPAALSRAWLDGAGLMLSNSWGMTELGPVGALARVRRHHLTDSLEQQLGVLSLAGSPAPLVRLRIGDGTGPAGTIGELQVSGPTVASGYHGDVSADCFTSDGWLRTGDIALLENTGDLRITDRLKDVIKSGGEWISSIDLENTIMDHPNVAEAAVIGVAHERWDERPFAFVVPRDGTQLTEDEILKYLRPRVAKFWMPDRIIIGHELPHTSTGKIAKATLREQYSQLQYVTEEKV